MTRTRWLQVGGIVLVFAVAVWIASNVLERVVAPAPAPSATPTPAPPTASVPHIIATLYYGTPDGQALAAVKREVPLGEGPGNKAARSYRVSSKMHRLRISL